MELKFYLNKLVKADNIEGYNLETLYTLKKTYDEFIERTGADPDFPQVDFGMTGKDGSKQSKMKFTKNPSSGDDTNFSDFDF